MLKFYRPGFMSGITIVKEKISAEGEPEQFTKHGFRVADQNKVASYQNEPYLLQKYPVLFTIVE
jgi:hypothetical protein